LTYDETIALRATLIVGKAPDDFTVTWRRPVDWPDHEVQRRFAHQNESPFSFGQGHTSLAATSMISLKILIAVLWICPPQQTARA
jgi:hypothetical protein